MKVLNICSKCGGPKSDRKHQYCNNCHAAYMRNWRKGRPLTPMQREKDIARSYAGVYLRKGLITKQPCEVCGNPKAEMHHDDYHRPTDVRWLCRQHHLELHRAEKHRLNNLQFVK